MLNEQLGVKPLLRLVVKIPDDSRFAVPLSDSYINKLSISLKNIQESQLLLAADFLIQLIQYPIYFIFILIIFLFFYFFILIIFLFFYFNYFFIFYIILYLI